MTDVLFTLTRPRLEAILQAMRGVRIGIIGDVALDVYWEADMTVSRLARENPYYFLPIVNERLSPGGGGNTAACVAALGVAATKVVSAIGTEWRGRELARQLEQRGVDTAGLLASDDWGTTTFAKPRYHGLDGTVAEGAHMYFENQAPLPARLEALARALVDKVCASVDAVIVADYQFYGTVTPAIRTRLCELGQQGLRIVVDSRDRIGAYTHVTLKPNELEAMRALEIDPKGEHDYDEIARTLATTHQATTCMTLGPQGSIWTDGATVTRIPAKPATGPVDPVGAGDCFAASLTSALAAGATGPEAAAIANLASGVIVRKVGTTGTATPEEILHRFDEEYNS